MACTVLLTTQNSLSFKLSSKMSIVDWLFKIMTEGSVELNSRLSISGSSTAVSSITEMLIVLPGLPGLKLNITGVTKKSSEAAVREDKNN